MTYRIDFNTPQGRDWFRAHVAPGFRAIGFACPIDAPLGKLAAFQALTRDIALGYRVEQNPGQWESQAPELGVLVIMQYQEAAYLEARVASYCRERLEECYLGVRGNAGTLHATFRYPNGHIEHKLTFWREGE